MSGSGISEMDGHTLRDIARGLLQRLLRKWIDEQLSRIVRAEIEAIVRKRVAEIAFHEELPRLAESGQPQVVSKGDCS